MIVSVNDAVAEMNLERALSSVSPERRAQALRYHSERDRRLSLAAYLLLKETLRQAFGIDERPRLATGPFGKPFLPDHPDIHFNLSHCARAAVCVVADRPVGIDVETIAPVQEAVAARVLSEAELASVRAAEDPTLAFAVLWTKKEALVKLTGEGLDDSRLRHLLDAAEGVRFETTVCRERGYVFTVAI